MDTAEQLLARRDELLALDQELVQGALAAVEESRALRDLGVELDDPRRVELERKMNNYADALGEVRQELLRIILEWPQVAGVGLNRGGSS